MSKHSQLNRNIMDRAYRSLLPAVIQACSQGKTRYYNGQHLAYSFQSSCKGNLGKVGNFLYPTLPLFFGGDTNLPSWTP